MASDIISENDDITSPVSEPLPVVTADDGWINLVTVDDAGNKADNNTGKGSVSYMFSIGECDITAQQYCDFLNAVATDRDPYRLYNIHMATDEAVKCINRIEKEGHFSYELVSSDAGELPITYVNLYSAARFCNWLQHGRLSGPEGAASLEGGAYELNGRMNGPIARTPEAKYFIPTEDEIYKSTYYKRGGIDAGYYPYPNRSLKAPTNNRSDQSDNEANYCCYYKEKIPTEICITPERLYSKSHSPYNGYDTGGNVDQWTETAKEGGDLSYIIRGGSWRSVYSWISENDLQSSSCRSLDPRTKSNSVGFRVASIFTSEVAYPYSPAPAVMQWDVATTAKAIGGIAFLIGTGYAGKRCLESSSSLERSDSTEGFTSTPLPDPYRFYKAEVKGRDDSIDIDLSKNAPEEEQRMLIGGEEVTPEAQEAINRLRAWRAQEKDKKDLAHSEIPTSLADKSAVSSSVVHLTDYKPEESPFSLENPIQSSQEVGNQEAVRNAQFREDVDALLVNQLKERKATPPAGRAPSPVSTLEEEATSVEDEASSPLSDTSALQGSSSSHGAVSSQLAEDMDATPNMPIGELRANDPIVASIAENLTRTESDGAPVGVKKMPNSGKQAGGTTAQIGTRKRKKSK